MNLGPSLDLQLEVSSNSVALVCYSHWEALGEKNFGDLEIQMAQFWSVATVVYDEQIKHGETVFCGGLLPKAGGIATGPQKGT